MFFFQFKQLTDYIYVDIYCELSKCIGQTPCSYEHYPVVLYVLPGSLVLLPEIGGMGYLKCVQKVR